MRFLMAELWDSEALVLQLPPYLVSLTDLHVCEILFRVLPQKSIPSQGSELKMISYQLRQNR